MMMKSLVLGIFAASTCLSAAGAAPVSGTVLATRDFQAADIASVAPQAVTLEDYVRADPTRISTRWMTELTIKTADGRRIKVVQARDTALTVGTPVELVTTDGRQRAVPKTPSTTP